MPRLPRPRLPPRRPSTTLTHHIGRLCWHLRSGQTSRSSTAMGTAPHASDNCYALGLGDRPWTILSYRGCGSGTGGNWRHLRTCHPAPFQPVCRRTDLHMTFRINDGPFTGEKARTSPVDRFANARRSADNVALRVEEQETVSCSRSWFVPLGILLKHAPKAMNCSLQTGSHLSLRWRYTSRTH
jgi:hypothetical protein